MQKSFLHATGPGSRGEVLTGTSDQIVKALIDLHFGEGVDRRTPMRTVAVVAANAFQVEAMQKASPAGTFSLDGCTMAEVGRLTRDRTITDWDSAPWLRRDVPLVLVHPATEGGSLPIATSRPSSIERYQPCCSVSTGLVTSEWALSRSEAWCHQEPF